MRPQIALSLFLTLASSVPARSAAPASADFGRAEQVHISLSSFRITPVTLHLKAGRPVVLTINNDGFGGHDFTAAEFFAAAAIRPGDAALIDKGTIKVREGGTAVIALTPSLGRYPMKCSHALHKMLGMSGSIDVTW